MTLATDILKRAGINLSPPPRSISPSYRGFPKTRTSKTKPSGESVKAKPTATTTLRTTTPEIKRHIPGIQRIERKRPNSSEPQVTWGAFYWDKKKINIGEFKTQERAFVALRLYKLWKRRSFDNIPNKPSFRTYTRSDKS